jgi:F0F1-type ATP synthase membrane subunit b/b'
MTKPKDAMIRNLQQRLKKALEEAKRQKQRAEDAELELELAEAEVTMLLYMQPGMVRRSYEVMH